MSTAKRAGAEVLDLAEFKRMRTEVRDWKFEPKSEELSAFADQLGSMHRANDRRITKLEQTMVSVQRAVADIGRDVMRLGRAGPAKSEFIPASRASEMIAVIKAIHAAFGANVRIDTRTHGGEIESLELVVHTNVGAKETLKRLNDFDESFWIDASPVLGEWMVVRTVAG